jgi:hypothetical protein
MMCGWWIGFLSVSALGLVPTTMAPRMGHYGLSFHGLMLVSSTRIGIGIGPYDHGSSHGSLRPFISLAYARFFDGICVHVSNGIWMGQFTFAARLHLHLPSSFAFTNVYQAH